MYRIAYILVLIPAVSIATQGAAIASTRLELEALSLIAWTNAIANQATPDGPGPDDDETHAREDCPTGGWITHGDGHKTRCPFCRPAFGDSSAGNFGGETAPPGDEQLPTLAELREKDGSTARMSEGSGLLDKGPRGTPRSPPSRQFGWRLRRLFSKPAGLGGDSEACFRLH